MSDNPHRLTEEVLRVAEERIRNQRPWTPPRPILSSARYEKCKRGEHELLHGFCVHCWTTLPPSS